MILGVFPSRIVTVLSPGWRAALSPCPGATVSHVHRTSRIWDSSRRTARTAPGKGEAKSLSGKILCYLKLSKTPLTKCYFGTNTCCQLTPGTATTAAPSASHAGSRLFPGTRFKSSKRRQNHRYNLPATPICPSAGIWGTKPMGLPSWGAGPKCARGDPQNVPLRARGFLTLNMTFPHATPVFLKPFCCCEAALGFCFPIWKSRKAVGQAAALGAARTRGAGRERGCRQVEGRRFADTGRAVIWSVPGKFCIK